MGRGGTPGQYPEAEDTRNEQFVNQGGEVRINGRLTVENSAVNANSSYYTLVSTERGARTTVGSLVINGTTISPSANVTTSGGSGQLRLVNNGTFAVSQ
jgi:hypothetical protein